jgi:septal ring factor EnvC (AmiA/AmiB activator)
MSSGNYKHGGKPQQTASKPVEEKPVEQVSAATVTTAEPTPDPTIPLRAEIGQLKAEIESIRTAAARSGADTSELTRQIDALNREISGFNSLIAQKDAANETRKKMLRWLIKNIPLHQLPHFLYGMTDECNSTEVHQIIDYMKTHLDARDSSLVESYRVQMADTADARLRAPIVKKESLAAMADQE